MAITLEILASSRIGSQFTSTIASDEEETKNDFEVLILTSDNGTGLTESDITLSSGTLVSLTGSGASWEATIRPPETAEVITVTIAADAFTEGNAETTHDIRVSTYFPDADAESPTSLFTHGLSNVGGIAVTPTRILVSQTTPTLTSLQVFTHSGTHQTGETLTGAVGNNRTQLDTINGDILVYHFVSGHSANRVIRWRADGTVLSEVERYETITTGKTGRGVAHTPLGITQIESDTTGVNPRIRIQAYGTTDTTEYDLATERRDVIAHQNNLLYAGQHFTEAFRAYSFWVAEITDADINFLKPLNVEILVTIADISIYRDTLYLIDDGRFGNNDVYTLDIRKYRPIAKNTKTTIYPVFANEGDTIDLTQYSPDAERIVPDVGFDKPDYLTFNTSNELEIDADAVTETGPVYIPLKAINRIDATETGTFGFYLIIQQASRPTWREFDDLSMPADSVFNLFDVVEGADSITGTTLPTGASVSNGRLNIGTAGGTVVVRATNASGNTNHTFIVNVVQAGDPANYSNEFQYRVQIANIDVTSDLKVSPSVSESLDAVVLNESVLDEVSFTLRNDVQNGFRFSDTTPNNFWVANSLTEGGYRVGVKIFVESLVSGSIVQSLLFVGVIFDSVVSIDNADIVFTIVDLSYTFDRRSVEGLGQLTKWDALRQETDEASFEGAYTPEGAVAPMQVRTGRAWSDRSPVTISDLGLPREGPALANTGYLTPDEFQCIRRVFRDTADIGSQA